MEITIRKCSIDDAKAIAELGATTFREAFSYLNDPAVIKRYLRTSFSRDSIRMEISQGCSSVFLLEAGECAAAYLKLNWPPGQSDLNEPGSLEIQRIYVKNCFQGLGLGRRLIHLAEQEGVRTGCQTLWLSTWKKNEKGLAFYKKMGFSIAGEKDFIMDNEVQYDYILKKEII